MLLKELLLAGLASVISANLLLCSPAALADTPMPAPTTEVGLEPH